MPLSAGNRLGRYEILSALGAGGMGEVYRARDTELERDVAIKVLPEAVARNPDRLARFENEVRAVARLSHPNILEIWDFGRHDDVVFAVTELLEGETLGQRLHDGLLGWRKTAEVGAAIADGLAATHRTGIVHRDLKPSNVFITTDGRVKILDFGLARHEGADRGKGETEVPTFTRQTDPGAVVGTVGYMSPEQVRCEPLDGRSDIFALGCVLYEMVSGRRAFAHDTAVETMNAILKEEPADLSGTGAVLPPELERTIRRCLEKSPDERFQSARDLAFTLRSPSSDAPRPSTSAIEVTPEEPQPSIAVLPFVNMSADPEQEYFCDGMAEEIINALTRIDDLRVVARTSAFSFKGKGLDIREIGSKLNANKVLEGSVRKAGDRLRIHAQLVNVADGYHIWSERYDTTMDDIFDVQDEISMAIVDNLKIQLSMTRRASVTRPPTENADAYNLYLKGLFFFNSFDFDAAVDCFSAAVRKAPSFALAYAGIANSYSGQCMGAAVNPPRDAHTRAKEAALKAVELEPDRAETHCSLGNVATYFDWDRKTARACFDAAYELNPNSCDVATWYAGYLISLEHEFGEGLAMLQRARELDPLDMWVYGILAWARFGEGEFETLVSEIESVLNVDPTWPYGPHALGEAYLGLRRFDEAIASYEEAIRRMGRVITNVGELGLAHGLAGNTQRAIELMGEVEDAFVRTGWYAGYLALIHIGMADFDGAFNRFKKALDSRDTMILWIASARWPNFEEFRNDPRYAEMMNEVGLAHLVHSR
jgi:serine/threonine protein kinase